MMRRTWGRFSQIGHGQILGIAFTLLLPIFGCVEASEKVAATKEVKTEQEDGVSGQIPGSKTADLRNSPDELLSIFNRAVALHQRALKDSNSQLLEEAATLYLAYLTAVPGAYSVANNLAKVYEELGQTSLTVKYYELAIKADDSRQRQFLENYAEFLNKKSANWQRESEVYSMLLNSYPLSQREQVKLAKRYAKKGLDEEIEFLWELFESGSSLQVTDMALEAVADNSGSSVESRLELLAIISAGLSRWDFDKTKYIENGGLRDRLLTLAEDGSIGSGISEIVSLLDLTLEIRTLQATTKSDKSSDCGITLLCQRFNPLHFSWWSGLEPHNQDPVRGLWPVDGFRALVRSLGEQTVQIAKNEAKHNALSAEHFKIAESYFLLAANLQGDEVDPRAVRELVRLKFETETKPNVEQVRLQYEQDVLDVDDSGDTVGAEGAFDYHKTLASYYFYLSNKGNTDAAKSAAYQLTEAQKRSYQQGECPKKGEVVGKHCFTTEMAEMLEQVCGVAGTCKQDKDPDPQPETEYIGDNIRIGIGYTSETDLTGEFFLSFLEDSNSATSIEGWKGQDSSGGLKVNFHWLSGGVQEGTDGEGNPFYSDGKVRKLFIAADQNVFSDAKMTFGGGSEHENKFWSLYGSKSVSGERTVGQTISVEELVEIFFEDNHQITQTDTWTTTTDFMTRPYKWGVGFRVGRYFEDSLLRLRGGFDYEDGDFSSYQLTGYASLDKRFRNSSQGLSFRAEVVRKQGDFETDKSDVRVSAFWSWEFGTSLRESAYETVSVTRSFDGSDLPGEQLTGIVPSQKTIPFDETSNFRLNKFDLTDVAKETLEKNLANMSQAKGKILITGHTCSLGSDDLNQKLSQQRAEAVADYLIKRDLDATVLCSVGRGEAEPMYSNDTEESRQRNRRVEISFVIDETKTLTSPAIEGGTYKGEELRPVPAQASWIDRALRNPVSHKRTVDYYSYNRVSEQHTTETVLKNSGAEAEGDVFSVDQNSTNNLLDILYNDYDLESDHLKIISVSTPAHGTVTLNGNSVTYTPNAGYSGPDSFTYEIEDIYVTLPHSPGESSTALVSITVVPILSCELMAEDDFDRVAKNSYDNPIRVLDNDIHPDGDPISITGVGDPANGTVIYTDNLVFYTPNPEFVGEDRFEYTIVASNGCEDTAWVTVIVGNQAPVAVDDFAETWKNIRVTIDVLANDYDPDGDDITIVDIIQDEHPMGTVTDNGDGTLTYMPMKGWFGGDKFQYTISDGELTSTATVTIYVKGIPRN